MSAPSNLNPSASLWYKDAVIYQVHIKAFADQNGDGIGDLPGLLGKLDYLQSLGVTAIWLLPFYPSPLRDDGYDIADYYKVHSQYGSLHDFRMFLREAHRRDLRVITELVINHTSDQHPWFQRARHAPRGSSERDFYVWSDTTDKYRGVRIIFPDFEPSNWTWDPVAKAYYWHRFFYHQPDLNFDNPAVRKAIFKVLDFWMDLGVDGLRLDAIPYLFEREGTSCENLPETHEFIQQMRAHVDKKYPDRMLLAEANQWPEDAVSYFGKGDSCHMAFHFPVMPRMFMALQMEDRYPIVDILEQTPTIPDNCQWAIFLRNHDELTLEMVTDEERDYMYRVYANDSRARINLGIRRRLAPLLGNNRRKIELINVLLLSLPGTPIIYYGDEIGMGDNIYLGDRNGVRTPMQWSADRNAGFSLANPQQLYLPVVIDPEFPYESINVENQEGNLSSLLHWMRRVISIRRRYRAFSRGSLTFLNSDNPKILSFLRQYDHETILVIVNLSRFAEAVELDLNEFTGFTPVEVFSQNPFPKIRGNVLYPLTVGPHGHYWLTLKSDWIDSRTKLNSSDINQQPSPSISELCIAFVLDGIKGWNSLLGNRQQRERFEKEILLHYLPACRWFRSKTRRIQQVRIHRDIAFGEGPEAPRLLWLRVMYSEGLPEVYLLPVQLAFGQAAERVRLELSNTVICEIRSPNGETGVIFDAVFDPEFRQSLLKTILNRKRLRYPAHDGELVGVASRPQRGGSRSINHQNGDGHFATTHHPNTSQVVAVEQSNTAIIYENQFFLKLYRKIEDGENPDIELTRHLSERQNFPHIPPLMGMLEYRGLAESSVGLETSHSATTRTPIRSSQTVGFLQKFVPNEGDAWQLTVESAGRFLERVLSSHREFTVPDPMTLTTISRMLTVNDYTKAQAPIPEVVGAIYPARAALLGTRTAEMHLALADDYADPSFLPESFTIHYQRALLQSILAQTRRCFEHLRQAIQCLDDAGKVKAKMLLGKQSEIFDFSHRVLRVGKLFSAQKMRVHGDYHLGQVLFTGKDFFIIDYEGEPTRPLSERRLKRSPMYDIAGMLRSFHYAVHTALRHKISVPPNVAASLVPWAELWYCYIAGQFLRAYREKISNAPFVPKLDEDFETLLSIYLLDKAVYQIGYELNNRPNWVLLPILGLEQIMSTLFN